jgi:hypothetical protein
LDSLKRMRVKQEESVEETSFKLICRTWMYMQSTIVYSVSAWDQTMLVCLHHHCSCFWVHLLTMFPCGVHWQDLHSLAFIQMHCLSFCQPSIFTSYQEF